MKKILESKYGLLIFSLLSGIGYFILVMMLVMQIKYSYLLGLFFFPAIVCGSALCIYKTIKNLQENNEMDKIRRFILIHIILIVFSFIGAITIFFLR